MSRDQLITGCALLAIILFLTGYSVYSYFKVSETPQPLIQETTRCAVNRNGGIACNWKENGK